MIFVWDLLRKSFFKLLWMNLNPHGSKYQHLPTVLQALVKEFVYFSKDLASDFQESRCWHKLHSPHLTLHMYLASLKIGMIACTSCSLQSMHIHKTICSDLILNLQIDEVHFLQCISTFHYPCRRHNDVERNRILLMNSSFSN